VKSLINEWGKKMTKPIRVLHILQRMEAGGTQALLMNIYRKIDRSLIQFDFLVEYPEKNFYDDEIISLGGKIYYSNVRNDLNIFKFEKKLIEILHSNQEYKIVHVHTYSIGYFCLKTAKKCGIPIRIAHSHSNAMTKDNKKYIKIFLQKLYTIYATDLLACSVEAGEYLFKNKYFKVFTNAIDSNKFSSNIELRDEFKKEFNLNNSFVVGHVGRFRPEKNHYFLIDVFYEIKKKKSNAVLILVGTGDLESKIHEKVESLGLSDSVKFLGNRTDMHKIYQMMDVCVFPSIYEGLGIVAIEAQAAGIPIVCSDRLPNESNISPLFIKKSLDDTPEDWAKICIKASENKLSHTDTKQYVINSGFDLDSTVKYIQNYYIDCFERIKHK
jgi:glycosyltransferase involved in cell wall biosynthesis